MEHVDRGWAWVVLAACFFTQLFDTGVLSSLGVFLIPWQTQFFASVTQVSWILSLTAGITHLTGPVGSALCKTFTIRQVVLAGAFISSCALTAASLSTQLWHLYVAFTVAGLGLGLSFQPCSVILIYYFDKRLGRANGLAQTGVAAGMFALPPLLHVSIDTYGWRGALLILGAITANIGVCGALFRPTPIEYENRVSGKFRDKIEVEKQNAVLIRTEPNQSTQTDYELNRTNINQQVTTKTEQDGDDDSKQNIIQQTRSNKFKCHGVKAVMYAIFESFDLKLLTKFRFCLLVCAYFFHAFAYVIIILYLPARAENVGISPLRAALLLSIFGIGSFISRLTHGYVIDYNILSVFTLTELAYILCAVSSALYPISDNYISLVILSLINGLTTGVFNSTIPLMVKEYVGIERLSGGLGLVLLFVGVSTILGSYLTGVLVDTTGSYSIPFYIAGASFALCSVLQTVYPITRYLRSRGSEVQELSVNVELEEPSR